MNSATKSYTLDLQMMALIIRAKDQFGVRGYFKPAVIVPNPLDIF